MKNEVKLYVGDSLGKYGFPNGHAFGPDRQDVFWGEFGSTDALLLFLDAAANFQRQAHGPFEVFVADFSILAGVDQFQQAADGLVDAVDVAA